jgi:hypothetical protein
MTMHCQFMVPSEKNGDKHTLIRLVLTRQSSSTIKLNIIVHSGKRESLLKVLELIAEDSKGIRAGRIENSQAISERDLSSTYIQQALGDLLNILIIFLEA